MIIDATFTEINRLINANFGDVMVITETLSDLPMWEGGSY